MDLASIINDWPHDDCVEAKNVRLVTGADGAPKVQLRIRCGVIQWEAEGRPDGTRPNGCPSMLEYCAQLLQEDPFLPVLPGEPPAALDPGLAEELLDELIDYCRRGRALFLLGEYPRAIADAEHSLAILRLLRLNCPGDAVHEGYDHYRPTLLLERARGEMMQHLAEDDVRGALEALAGGIDDIDAFHLEYELVGHMAESSERQVLVDLRRSLREKHNVPLNDMDLLQSLTAEQAVAISRENYEMAARLRDKISLLRRRLAGRI